jgi:hypothetical protein
LKENEKERTSRSFSFINVRSRSGNLPAASTSAAVATTATPASASAAAASTVLSWTGLVDDHVAAIVLATVELSNRIVRGILASHLDEAESARAAGFTVGHHIGRIYLTGRSEMLMKVLARDAEGQVSYVKFRTHFSLNVSERSGGGRYEKGRVPLRDRDPIRKRRFLTKKIQLLNQ